jgi:hypothetical protein
MARGEGGKAHDEAEAEWLVRRRLEELGLPVGRVALAGGGKWQRAKALVCALVRRRTGVSNGWLAARFRWATKPA